MREIKFRGKDYYNKWRHGDLVQEKWAKGKAITIKKDKNGWSVLEETVGQYTGLKDDNEKEIYEGDILLIDAYTYTNPVFSEEYLVQYNEVLGMWQLIKLENYKKDKKDFMVFEDLKGWYRLDIAVIGNIYDNPELLKED